MNESYIHYYKWNDLNKKFFQSGKEFLNIIKPNFYNPIYSLYFYIHNTNNARKTMENLRKPMKNKGKERGVGAPRGGPRGWAGRLAGLARPAGWARPGWAGWAKLESSEIWDL